jgi:hypothetical protein
MNPELKAKWIAALRSGKYTQLRGRYCGGENEYCALGLLYMGLRWLERMKGKILPKEQHRAVSSLNDSGASFAEIADYIESNL